MQISTHELVKLMAEVANREVGAYIEKQKQEVKPKRNLLKIEVIYEFYDCIKDISTYSYNIITTTEGCNAVKMIVTQLQVLYLVDDINIEYNPVCMCYDGYKHTDSDGKIRVFSIRNIRDRIIDRIEV